MANERILFMKINGIFKNYVYRNEKDGYSGFFIFFNDKMLFCKGFIQDLVIETPIVLDGNFNVDEFNREFFEFTNYELTTSTKFYEEKYINSLNIKGLTKKDTTELMNYFNSGLLSVVLSCKNLKAFKDRCPEKYKPISSKIYRRIHSIEKTKELFDLIMKVDGNYNCVRKMISTCKSSIDAIALLKKNPYGIGLICGLSFKSCDKLARIYNLTYLNHDRVVGLINNCLLKSENDGNTFTTINELRSRCSYEQKGSAFKQIPFQYILSECVLNDNIIVDKNYIYRKIAKEMEDCVIENCNRIIRSSIDIDKDDNLIKELENEENIHLSKSQENAMSALYSTGIKVITGGPGSGKTTLMNIIIKYCQKAFPDKEIALCAPTGCAAQNLAIKTNNNAETIHKLLNILPYDTENEKAIISRKKRTEFIYIIDESSMLDLNIASILLSQIPNNALVLFIGDINQLPSVQVGNILSDLISGGVETYYLEGSFRQTEASPIIKYANNIKNEILFKENDGADGFSILTSDSEETTLELCKLFAYEKNEYQILSAGKKHLAGTRNINNELQLTYLENDYIDTLNKKIFGMNIFYVGDKVIFTSNNYNEGYYNGNIGEVIDVYPEGMEIKIDNDKTINIKNLNLEDVSLAYALTVHKSQGAEYDNVIIVLDPKFLMILNKNLLYTAVTRAKKSIIIITPDINFLNSIILKQPPHRNSNISNNIIKK